MTTLRGLPAPLFVLAVAALAAGCNASHTGDDAGAAAGCVGPAPTGCILRRGATGCCDRGPGTCVDGVWSCETEMGRSCEGPCGTEVCSSPPPTCREDLGEGCCGAVVDPVCFTPSWSCPPGSVEERTCVSPDCVPPTACDGLTEAQCIGASTCTPLYDDLCCPSCVPIGACADCERLAMYRCAPIDEACATGVCGRASSEHCAERLPDCSAAVPTTGYRCSEPGCVAALMAGCADDCPLECVPVTAASCEATCDAPEPACPPNTVAEAASGCYTGRCIAASACEVAPSVGP